MCTCTHKDTMPRGVPSRTHNCAGAAPRLWRNWSAPNQQGVTPAQHPTQHDTPCLYPMASIPWSRPHTSRSLGPRRTNGQVRTTKRSGQLASHRDPTGRHNSPTAHGTDGPFCLGPPGQMGGDPSRTKRLPPQRRASPAPRASTASCRPTTCTWPHRQQARTSHRRATWLAAPAASPGWPQWEMSAHGLAPRPESQGSTRPKPLGGTATFAQQHTQTRV